MGMKMGGFLAGLGQGVNTFGQSIAQGRELDRQEAERTRLAQQQAAMLALQQDAAQRAETQQAFARAQAVVGNLPAGTPLDPQTRSMIEQGGWGAFVKPDFAFGAKDAQGIPEVPISAGMPTPGQGAPSAATPGAVDTGRGISIPTEDSRARTAAAAQQAAMIRAQLRATTQMQVQAERSRIDAEANRIREMVAKDNRLLGDARIQQAWAGIQQRAQDLDRLERQFNANEDYRYNVEAPNIAFDNALGKYNAENPRPATGGGGMASYGVLAGAGGGAAPTAAAPPAKRPPAPTPPKAPARPPAQPPAVKPPAVPKKGTGQPAPKQPAPPGPNGEERGINQTGDLVQKDPATGAWVLITPAP